jgi:bifunctional non-homologous end joining protein LigD
VGEPSFVAEVEFRDITSEGLLRQSSFKGLAKREG